MGIFLFHQILNTRSARIPKLLERPQTVILTVRFKTVFISLMNNFRNYFRQPHFFKDENETITK